MGSFSRRMIEGLIREGEVRPILGILGVYRLVAGFLIAAFATATDASGASVADEPTLVQIDGGEVRGTAANGVMAFKGIPFAQPPVGALRWRPPQPVAPWKGILKASQLQFDCPQPSSLLPSASKGTSEDSLHQRVASGFCRGQAATGHGLDPRRRPRPRSGFALSGRLPRPSGPRLRQFQLSPRPARVLRAPGPRQRDARSTARQLRLHGPDPIKRDDRRRVRPRHADIADGARPLPSGDLAVSRHPDAPRRRTADALSCRRREDRWRLCAFLGSHDDDKAALAKLRALPAATFYKGTEDYVSSVFGGPEIPGLSFSIVDGGLVAEPPEMAIRAGRQAMVPVIVGANDADLGASTAKTKDELFALFGPLASRFGS